MPLFPTPSLVENPGWEERGGDVSQRPASPPAPSAWTGFSRRVDSRTAAVSAAEPSPRETAVLLLPALSPRAPPNPGVLRTQHRDARGSLARAPHSRVSKPLRQRFPRFGLQVMLFLFSD